MNPFETSDTSSIERQAVRQLADYDARRPGTMFAEGVVLNVGQAYALQTAVADLRYERGERLIGYKVGCTSATIRAQLGIDHCIAGRLFEAEQHPSGISLSRHNYAKLAIEGELAVELSREPNGRDFDDDGVPACVGRVFPVVELHNHVIRSDRPSAGELIANNAIHAGFVAGSGHNPQTISCDQPNLTIFADDRLLDQCAGDALVRTIHDSLKWLMEMVRDRGQRLQAGQIVLTGSIPGLFPIRDECRINVETSPFGSVSVEFTN